MAPPDIDLAHPVFESVAVAMPDVLMVLDREARIVFINHTAPSLTVEKVLGTRVYDWVPPDQHAGMRGCFARVAETGEPDRYDNVYTTLDGELTFWESRVGALKDGEELRGFVVVSGNVTERREAAAERDRMYLMSIDALCIADFEARLLRVSPALERMLGFNEEHLCSVPLLELIHDGDRQRTREVIQVLRGGVTAQHFESRLRTASGNYRTLQWHATSDPATERIYAVGRDVTDLRELEAQLIQAQKMEALGQLAGGVAHDFNNLLLAITGNLELAARLEPKNAALAELHGQIDAAATRAAELTRRLLAFSRKQPLARRRMDLGAVVADMQKLLRRLLPENIELSFRTPSAPLIVEGDRPQLEQVLLNLCVNARDAMVDGGTLVVQCDALDRAGSSFARLRVTDTGQGIPSDATHRIFEPFFTTKEVGSGSGLGLSVAYGIVKRHQGAIEVTSEPGRGAEFCVLLPMADGKPDVAAREPRELPLGGSEMVLVVEDEPNVRSVVTRALRDAGYRIVEAGDGTRGLAAFERHPEIAVAVVDVAMPGLSGVQLVHRMRELRPGMSAILVTGFIAKDEALPEGVPLLIKPFPLQELLRCVRCQLDTQCAR